ncbi:MAG: ABC transporter permease [Eubacterium sp.]|nr:ABC transporter permease [Eubacterium sp.]
MNFSENLRLAWSCVRANKMRSILTMLGIIIGISSVITISTIGSSLRQTIQKTFSDLTGTNQLGVTWMDPTYKYETEQPMFTLDDMYKYKQAFSGMVSDVNMDYSLGETIYTDGDNEANVNVIGTTEAYCKTMNYEIVYGRDINFDDSFGKKRVCVVSENFVKYGLGGMDNPIGEHIEMTLSNKEVMDAYIIGVYKQTRTQMANLGQQSKDEKDQATEMILPVQYAWDLANEPEFNRNFWAFYFFNEPGVDVSMLKENTKAYFERTNRDTNYEILVQSLEEQLKMINTVLNVITAAISIIAAISLIVGGIGVMNIMLVSVVERTKEIGIRKALGAKNRVIEMQFLVEAVLICAIGGIIGILLGLVNGGIISFVVKQIVQSQESLSMLTVAVSPPYGAIIISFLFSSLVGVVFGLYPARRAARLSPIDALRYE